MKKEEPQFDAEGYAIIPEDAPKCYFRIKDLGWITCYRYKYPGLNEGFGEYEFIKARLISGANKKIEADLKGKIFDLTCPYSEILTSLHCHD